MMAIPQSRYVSITSGTAGQSAIGERDLNGLAFTYGEGWIGGAPFDPDSIVVCYNIDDVMKYFSSTSDEVAFATKYFAYISPSGTTPASLTFAKMKVTDSSGNNLIYKTDGWYTGPTKATGAVTVTSDSGTGTLTVGKVNYVFTTSAPTQLNQIQIVLDQESLVDKAATLDNIKAVINGTGGYAGQTANPDVVATTISGDVLNLEAISGGAAGNNTALEWVGDELTPIVTLTQFSGGSDIGTKVTSPVQETPSAAVARVDGGTNNFGSFAFIDAITDAQAKDVAVLNAGYNYKYLCSLGSVVGTSSTPLAATIATAQTVGATNGCALTQGVDRFASAIPMAIFASTDYSGTNTATTLMFKQISGEQASVTDSDSADTLDGLYVNYYGQTQANGRQLSFYQRGVNLDGQDTAVYCNEVWLQSAIATEIMNLLVSVERVPANEDGESMLNSTISAVAQRAVGNGVFEIGKTYTSAQRAAIFQLTGDKDAVTTMQNSGYWLDVVIEEDGGQYKARYLLVYGKGDSVRKVEGRDILI